MQLDENEILKVFAGYVDASFRLLWRYSEYFTNLTNQDMLRQSFITNMRNTLNELDARQSNIANGLASAFSPSKRARKSNLWRSEISVLISEVKGVKDFLNWILGSADDISSVEKFKKGLEVCAVLNESFSEMCKSLTGAWKIAFEVFKELILMFKTVL